jgi:hypothetical protein
MTCRRRFIKLQNAVGGLARKILHWLVLNKAERWSRNQRLTYLEELGQKPASLYSSTNFPVIELLRMPGIEVVVTDVHILTFPKVESTPMDKHQVPSTSLRI